MAPRSSTLAMESASSQLPSISKQRIAAMTPEAVAELAARLESDSYNSPFEALQDWHLLRAIALQRPDLAEDYHYLLDFEAFDEA
jgi:hypothetical protein